MMVASRARLLDIGLAQGDDVLLVRDRALGHVEQLVLDEDDRVVVADGGLEQAAGVVGSRGHDHLEPGDVVEERLQALGVLGGKPVAGTPLGAQHHGDLALPAGDELVFGRLVDDLVHDQHGEIDEEDFDDGPAAD